MTVKNRIAKIRLSEKLDRNMEYAESIGVYVVNRKTDVKENKIYKNGNGGYYKTREGEEYEDERRTADMGNGK